MGCGVCCVIGGSDIYHPHQGIVMDMFGYTPNLFHAVATAFLCVVFIAISSFVPSTQPRLLSAFYIGAVIFAIMTAVIMWMLVVNTNVEAAIRQDEAATAFGLMLAHPNMTDEKLQMLAGRFPKLRYRMTRGEVRAFFESTKVPISKFKLFLETSNKDFISPERNWNTAEMPREIWLEIFHWLESNDKIIPDSAAGSHSWRWIGKSYQQMCAYWMSGRHLVDLNKVERIAAQYDKQVENDG